MNLDDEELDLVQMMAKRMLAEIKDLLDGDQTKGAALFCVGLCVDKIMALHNRITQLREDQENGDA